MRKQNDFDLYKIEKTNPRIFKIKQLIKKSLCEIFLSHDFRTKDGKDLLIFIDDIILSKDARVANVFLTNFSNDTELDGEEILSEIDNSLQKIKKEFSSKIELRYTPKLRFKFDGLREKSFKIDQKINNLSKTK